jgi:hypothetical protein
LQISEDDCKEELGICLIVAEVLRVDSVMVMLAWSMEARLRIEATHISVRVRVRVITEFSSGLMRRFRESMGEPKLRAKEQKAASSRSNLLLGFIVDQEGVRDG